MRLWCHDGNSGQWWRASRWDARGLVVTPGFRTPEEAISYLEELE